MEIFSLENKFIISKFVLSKTNRMKKILAFAGSNSSTSINKQLAKYASSLLKDVDVNLIDLNDFKAPLFGKKRTKFFLFFMICSVSLTLFQIWFPFLRKFVVMVMKITRRIMWNFFASFK